MKHEVMIFNRYYPKRDERNDE